jgi:hypothetical protein
MSDQLLWAIFSFTVISVASAAAAFGGAKYALRIFEQRIIKLELKTEDMVSHNTCRDMRVDCNGSRQSDLCEINRKIDRIYSALEDMERKREAGKDSYLDKFERLAVQIESIRRGTENGH